MSDQSRHSRTCHVYRNLIHGGEIHRRRLTVLRHAGVVANVAAITRNEQSGIRGAVVGFKQHHLHDFHAVCFRRCFVRTVSNFHIAHSLYRCGVECECVLVLFKSACAGNCHFHIVHSDFHNACRLTGEHVCLCFAVCTVVDSSLAAEQIDVLQCRAATRCGSCTCDDQWHIRFHWHKCAILVAHRVLCAHDVDFAAKGENLYISTLRLCQSKRTVLTVRHIKAARVSTVQEDSVLCAVKVHHDQILVVRRFVFLVADVTRPARKDFLRTALPLVDSQNARADSQIVSVRNEEIFHSGRFAHAQLRQSVGCFIDAEKLVYGEHSCSVFCSHSSASSL